MENNIEKLPFKKISILSLEGSSRQNSSNYNFLFILNGSIRIQSSKENFFLDSQDILLLTPKEAYTFSGRGNTLLLSIEMDNSFLLRNQPAYIGSYICNSSADNDRDYTPIRNLLSQIATVYFKNEDYNNLNLFSLAYQLIYYLNCYHFEKAEQAGTPHINPKYCERINDILTYINQNYANNITLQDLADQVHLTTPYLSKFFKNNFHTTFNNYLNHVRLTYAVEDLVYSNESITSIANHSGFASINAFNKLFKLEYHTTPNKYRLQQAETRLKPDTSGKISLKEMDYDTHKQLLQEYAQSDTELLPKFQFPSQREIRIKDVHAYKQIRPIWHSMINLGSTLHIAKRDINKQIALLQGSIKFQYARIEAILNDLFIPKDPDTGKYNFTAFDRAIDLLQTQDLIPYLDLSYPEEVLEATDQRIISYNLENYLDIVNALIIHSANSFGIDEVEKWVFEIGYFQNLVMDKIESVDQYVDRFFRTYQLVKNYLPEAMVGGINYHLAYPWKRLEEILSSLDRRGFNPDFISLSIFPYELTEKKDAPLTETTAFVYSTDANFAKNKLQAFKKQLSKYKNLAPKIFISALGPSIRKRNYMNDTCYQATFFVKNTIDLLDEVDLLGYYQLSDSAFDRNESTHFLNGHNGIMNQYGIKKPGWLALEAINHNGHYLIDKGSKYMVTKSRREIYYLTICNYIHVNDSCCLNVHKEMSIKDAYSAYAEPKTQKISVSLGNMVNGLYQVITYRINKNHGSLLDEWSRIGYWEEVTRREFDYFKNIVQPKRNYQYLNCTDGMLEFNLQLAPHEVIFIEVALALG